jgi:hypothetical protein
VGLPWSSLLAFLRISTHARASIRALDPIVAWARVEDWLSSDVAWIPVPTPGHAQILGRLMRDYHVTGDLLTDAHIAALAIEYGLAVASADTDFARFTEVTWVNPLA